MSNFSHSCVGIHLTGEFYPSLLTRLFFFKFSCSVFRVLFWLAFSIICYDFQSYYLKEKDPAIYGMTILYFQRSFVLYGNSRVLQHSGRQLLSNDSHRETLLAKRPVCWACEYLIMMNQSLLFCNVHYYKEHKMHLVHTQQQHCKHICLQNQDHNLSWKI